MMEQSLNGVFRPSLLDRHPDEPRDVALRYGATATVRTLDRTAQKEWPLWALLDVPLTGRAPHRAETTETTRLGAIRRLVTTIRRWQRRARSRQELGELSDHMLKDIGLRREEVGSEFPQLFCRCD
jgi:uncharacterized protein YjiS (DUF1127 family)